MITHKIPSSTSIQEVVNQVLMDANATDREKFFAAQIDDVDAQDEIEQLEAEIEDLNYKIECLEHLNEEHLDDIIKQEKEIKRLEAKSKA